MNNDEGDGSSRNTLRIVLCFNVFVTAGEFFGAKEFNSSMLWQNFVVGLLDSTLIFINVLGWKQEARGGEKASRIGRRIASGSDVMLGLAFVALGLNGLAHLLSGSWGPVSNGKTFVLASAVAAVDGICAWLCPTELVNGASARLKLLVGTTVGLATIVTSGLAHLFQCNWLDPLATSIVALGVVMAVTRALIRRRRA